MPHGIYPMLYAFFNAQGGLDRQATRRQVQAFVDNGAHGMAVLGLGTEVNKLSDIERRQLVDWVADRVELPVAIQSAPEYLGVGLTPAGVKTLARNHPNFRILKAEGAALAIRQVIEEVGDGRAPALQPNAFGMRCAQRYAAALGPLA